MGSSSTLVLSHGLLHVTDLSWDGSIILPKCLMSATRSTVKVLKYDLLKKERVSLEYKQLQPDPWSVASHQYPVGMRVTGKVVNLTDYGAFVELKPGVEGLIHVSERRRDKRVKHSIQNRFRSDRTFLKRGAGSRLHGEPPHFVGSQADRTGPVGRTFYLSAIRSGRSSPAPVFATLPISALSSKLK